MGSRPLIVRNPAADVAFQKALDEIVERGASDPGAAQDALRQLYPRAVVRRRELESERAEVWYAYREGRWVPGD